MVLVPGLSIGPRSPCELARELPSEPGARSVAGRRSFLVALKMSMIQVRVRRTT